MTPKPIVITSSEVGRTLAAIIKSRLRITWTAARAAIAAGRVRIDSRPCRDSVRRMKRNERIEIAGSTTNRVSKKRRRLPVKPRPTRPQSSSFESIPIVYVDDAVVVVDKPAGLTTMRHAAEAAEFGPRGRRYLPPTLQDRLAAQFPGGPLRAVHRIDRETSGLVVFARTPDAERRLGSQFRAHTVMRRYLAIVRGQPPEGKIESWFIADRGDGRRGSGPPGTGQRAVTHVRVFRIVRRLLADRVPPGNRTDSPGAHPSRRSRRASRRRDIVRSATARRASTGPVRRSSDRPACRIARLRSPSHRSAHGMGIAPARRFAMRLGSLARAKSLDCDHHGHVFVTMPFAIRIAPRTKPMTATAAIRTNRIALRSGVCIRLISSNDSAVD